MNPLLSRALRGEGRGEERGDWPRGLLAKPLILTFCRKSEAGSGNSAPLRVLVIARSPQGDVAIQRLPPQAYEPLDCFVPAGQAHGFLV